MKDIDMVADDRRYTLVWFDDDKLFKQLEASRYGMPLDIDDPWADPISIHEVCLFLRYCMILCIFMNF